MLRPPRLNIRYSGEDEILRCHAPYAGRREGLIGTVQSRPEKGQIVAKNDGREKNQDQHDDDLCGRCRDESHLRHDEGESGGMGGKEDARGANHYERSGDGNVRDAQDQYEMNEKVHSPLHSLRDPMTQARREPPLPPRLVSRRNEGGSATLPRVEIERVPEVPKETSATEKEGSVRAS